jgi:hypothetical protein
MNQPAHATRLERILGVGLTEDAVRQWPQSGELIRGRRRIAEVESHFVGLRLGVGRRHALGDTVVVEWSTDYRRPSGRLGPPGSGAAGAWQSSGRARPE